MRYFLLLIVFIFITNKSNGQSYRFLGSRVYGGNKGENCNHLLKVTENKLLLIGESNSDATGNKTTFNCDPLVYRTDIWAVLVDTNFNILWQISLGGILDDKQAFAINAGNGNILISCISQSDSSCNRNTQLKGGLDVLLFMIDTLGNVIWEKNFGTIQSCTGVHLSKLSDGNYVMLTSSSAGIGNDKTGISHGMNDIWLVKFQPNGNIIFDKTYGGGNEELPWNIDGQTSFGLIENNANEIAIFTNTKSSNSWDVSDTNNGFTDFWMFIIDSSGNKISDFCYGGSINDYFTAATKNSSGYLIGGTSNSPLSGSISQPLILPGTNTGWIISVDTSGNKIWDRRYQGGNISSFNPVISILDILPASNGEYWVTATCNTSAGKDVTDNPLGDSDAWIFKIDNIGNVLWDKRFGSPHMTKTSNSVLMADSSVFVFCSADTGITNVKAELGYGASDYYLVHFRYDNVTTFVSEVTSSLELIYLYPNPASNNFFIKHSSDVKIQFVDILSMSGQVVKSFGTACSNYNIEDLPNAVYLCRIKTNKGEVFRKISRL